MLFGKFLVSVKITRCLKDVNKFNKSWCCLFSGWERSKENNIVLALSHFGLLLRVSFSRESFRLIFLSPLIPYLTFIFLPL